MRTCKCGSLVADKARFCPKCGHRFTSGALKALAWLFGIIIVLAVISASVNRENSPTPSHYTIPAHFDINPVAERGNEGEIYITGTANFPDGMKMWVQLGTRKAQANAFVTHGRFRSEALYKDMPITGKQPVEFIAYFNGAWQNNDVLAILGDGGKNLKGDLFKLTDPDVIDSDKILDVKFYISLPPIPLEVEAVQTVKHAVLTVPDKGRSATDVEKNIELFESPGTGVTAGKGWSATRTAPDVYNVSYDFINGQMGAKQAIWTVNLATHQVKYVNEAAKLFSWTPNY